VTKIKNILKEVRTIAVVGASSNKDRDSFKVMKALIDNGYTVYPVNPNEKGKVILGQQCFPCLESLKDNIDMVDIFRNYNAVMDITKMAIKVGAKVLWMQEGIIHNQAAELAQNAGLKVVMDKCPKKELLNTNWTSKTK